MLKFKLARASSLEALEKQNLDLGECVLVGKEVLVLSEEGWVPVGTLEDREIIITICPKCKVLVKSAPLIHHV
jgi:hypothetical protein